MIVEDYLGVVRGKDLSPGHILILFDVGVHVDNFPVPFVPEEETSFSTS